MALDLQVEEPRGVAGVPRGCCHELEPQRFQPEESVGVEQRTGMNEEELIATPNSRRTARVRTVAGQPTLPAQGWDCTP